MHVFITLLVNIFSTLLVDTQKKNWSIGPKMICLHGKNLSLKKSSTLCNYVKRKFESLSDSRGKFKTPWVGFHCL